MANKDLKYKWIEVPSTVTCDKPDGSKITKDTTMRICLDPPMECCPHPLDEGKTIFRNAFGGKVVSLPYKKFGELLDA